MKNRLLGYLFVAAASLGGWARAGTTYHFEYQSDSNQAGALGESLFGDTINYGDGGVQFHVTDVTANTNVQLPLSFSRKLTPDRTPQGWPLLGQQDFSKNILGEYWQPDLPVMSGIYPTNDGRATGQSARCTGGLVPSAVPLYPYTGVPLLQYNFWFGVFANIPGNGEEKLLTINSGTPVPSDGEVYKYVTSSNWRVSCLPALKNGPGEGYVVTLPNGSKYYFDWLATRAEPRMYIPGGDSNGTTVNRETMFFFATKAVDRFGNSITYTYDPANPTHLLSMVASDGAAITINYGANGRVSSVSTNGRTWTYSYTADPDYADNPFLSSVTLPDASSWRYEYTNHILGYSTEQATFGNNCDFSPGTMTSAAAPSGQVGSIKITHPSGAVGEFKFRPIVHGANNVTQGACGAYAPTMYGGPSYTISGRPKAYPLSSLYSKSISGLALATKTWTLSYSPSWSYASECTNGGCPKTSTTAVATNDGKIETYVFGNDFQTNANQLLSHKVAGANATKTTTYTYLTSAEGQPFPDYVGGYIGDPVYETLDNPRLRQNRPQAKVVTTLDGVNFTSQVNAFDVFARPTSVAKSNSLGFAKTDETTYSDDFATWALGLVTQQKTNGVVTTSTTFNEQDLPSAEYEFGKLKQTLTYNVDGNVATVKDGKNNLTSFSNWYRGVPGLTTYADGTKRSATPDGNGWVTSVTDENGYKTCYSYDAMGRVSKITYPSETQVGVCDTSAWNPTTITFTSGNAAAYGVPAGHWRQTTLTGNARHILVFDALLRPVVDQTLDLANVSSTLIEVIKRYDHSGRLAFQSYPMNTGGQAVYTDTTLKGTHTYYDALGRVTQSDQDSELGVLSTTTAYLSGFETQVTDPRLIKTITGYMAYDEPTAEWPVDIDAADGTSDEANTEIARDVFGKPVSIVRHNPSGTVQEARSYTYNANQELCRLEEPESGATLMGYDQAGNLLWSASGLPAGTPCDSTGTTTAVLDRKAARSYDARNRLQTLSFADGQSDATYDYFADGALASVTALNGGSNLVTTSYGYNKRRLLTSERMQWGAIDWSIGYGYDANGALASQGYPSGLSVNYLPNALGQPTQAGSYATGVSYWPNGGMKQFTYGNGIVHTLAQNARGLPERSRDTKSGISPVLDDSYDYDANGNVLAISDGRSGSRGNRDMTYDGLNRLKTTTSPMFNGTVATYTYDVLDNLRTVKAPGRDQTYLYDQVTWQLTNIKNTADGSTVVGLGYDVQGNVNNKNGMQFTFDMANRLRGVTGMAASSYVYDGFGRRVRDYTTASKYSLYSKAGQLVYDNNLRTSVSTNYIYLNGSLVAQNSNTAGLGTPVLTVPGSNTSGGYTVSWSALSAANRYDLQEQFNGGSWAPVYSGTGTSVALTGKASGSWGYRVRGCADAVCGSWSAIANVTESLPPATAPTLTVPATGLNGSYAVSWTGVSGATSYTLEQSFNGGTWAMAYTGSTLSASFTGKAEGSYSYRAKACNSSGCSTVSAIETVQVVYPPASAPTLTVPSTSYTGGYTISWTAVSTATSYTVEESINGGTWTAVYTGAALSKSVSGAATGSHAYRAKACNIAGCSALSATDTVQVTYPPASAPNLTVPATSYTGSYTISWTAVGTATSYTIEESTNGGTWAAVYTGAALSKAVSGAAAGSHAYRAKACNAAGCTGLSATDTVQVTYPPSAAPAVTTPASDGDGSWTVSWTAVSTATSYQLDESVNGGVWTNIQDSSARSRAISGKADGSYGYRARACNVAGCGPYSATRTTVMSITPPASPPSLNVPSAPAAGSPYTITWTTVALATSYQLDELPPSGAWTNVYNGAGTQLSRTHSVGQYGYRVRACNSKGCSAYSATQFADVMRDACQTCLLPSTGPGRSSPPEKPAPKGGK